MYAMSRRNRKPETVVVRNINHPGKASHLDARMYRAMKRAYLEVLPRSAPGLTLAEIGERLLPLLPQELYPNGNKAGWWAKTVQLDLEAKGVIERERVRPLRLRRGRRAAR
jgi:hypothetical protein